MQTIKIALFAIVLTLVVGAGSASAANDPDLTQDITAGTLSTDVIDNLGATVASPSAALSTETFSFDCQTSTGVLGTNTQRIYVMNPDGADNGWTLTIAATSGATALWQNGGATQFFDFNDPTTSGCTDGVDADSRPGQLSIDPSVGSITTDCLACVVTNVSLGSASAFSQGVTDSITLINAAAASDDIWRGYLEDVDLSQTLPAEQPADSYTINLTLTATAS
jgi:hypothetical protein